MTDQTRAVGQDGGGKGTRGAPLDARQQHQHQHHHHQQQYEQQEQKQEKQQQQLLLLLEKQLHEQQLQQKLQQQQQGIKVSAQGTTGCLPTCRIEETPLTGRGGPCLAGIPTTRGSSFKEHIEREVLCNREVNEVSNLSSSEGTAVTPLVKPNAASLTGSSSGGSWDVDERAPQEQGSMSLTKDAVCCELCLEPFETQEPKTPCVLPCFHTFCRKCLADWADAEGKKGGQDGKGGKEGGGFTCPTCREECQVKVKDLQINFDALSDAERYCVLTGKVVLVCNECEEVEAVQFCQQCSLWLCTGCSEHHHQKKSTKHHVLQTKEEVAGLGGEFPLPKQPQFCRMLGHNAQELRLFCLTCTCEICQDCMMMGDHRDHEVQPKVVFEQQYAKELSDEVAKGEERKRRVREGIDWIKAEEAALPEAARVCKDDCHAYYARLEDAQQEELSEAQVKKQKVLAEQRGDLEVALARLERGCAHARRTLSSRSFQSYRSISDGLRGLQSTEHSLEPRVRASDMKFVAHDQGSSPCPPPLLKAVCLGLGSRQTAAGKPKREIEPAQYRPGSVIDCSVLELKFERPFEGGVLEHIATGGGKRAWSNPHDKKLVKASCSYLTCGSESCFVDGSAFEPQSCYTRRETGSWMAVDLRRELAPTHYCLRSDNSEGHKLRSWRLQASKNGRSWDTLREHRTDTSLQDVPCSVADWPIEGFETTFFRHFRILITGNDSSKAPYMRCQGIELWGRIC